MTIEPIVCDELFESCLGDLIILHRNKGEEIKLFLKTEGTEDHLHIR